MCEILKDEEFLPAAVRLITHAHKSIFIATFKAEMPKRQKSKKLQEFFSLLVSKAADGLDVRLLINLQDHRGHIPASNAILVRYLQNSKVQVRQLQNSRICHAKVIIVDRKKAILGSHNLSVKSCHYNFELSAFITDITASGALEYMYNNLWQTAKKI